MALIVDDLLLAPFKLIYWLAQKIEETARTEITDESKVHERLIEAQMRHELGELTEDEYLREEERLMKELEAIRKLKGQ